MSRTAVQAASCESLYAIVVTANCVCAVDIKFVRHDSGSRLAAPTHPTWPALSCPCLMPRGPELRGLPRFEHIAILREYGICYRYVELVFHAVAWVTWDSGLGIAAE